MILCEWSDLLLEGDRFNIPILNVHLIHLQTVLQTKTNTNYMWKTFYASLIIVKAIFFCLTLWVGWSSCSNVGQTWEIVSPSAQCVIASIIGNWHWEKFHLRHREQRLISLSHSTAFKEDKKCKARQVWKVVINNSSRALDCLSSHQQEASEVSQSVFFLDMAKNGSENGRKWLETPLRISIPSEWSVFFNFLLRSL